MPLFKRKSPNLDEFTERYEVIKKLGSGGFSDVFSVKSKKTRGEDETNTFAAKVIEKKKLKQTSADAVQLEIQILSSTDHTNIVKLIESFENKKNIYVILTLITGGELFDRILEVGYYSEKDAGTLVHQILSGVNYLHEKGIVHRDLKPENLLMLNQRPDSPVIISDFGLSCYASSREHMRQSCGTPGYVAPEVLLKKQYDEKIDCWSVGVVTYILLCGYPPFYGDTDQEIYEQIIHGSFEYDSPSWDAVSKSAKDFIDTLIKMNPRERATSKEAIGNYWIKNEEKSEVDLSTQVKENLKAFLAKSRWKKAFNAQKAIRRMQLLTGGAESASNAESENVDSENVENENTETSEEREGNGNANSS